MITFSNDFIWNIIESFQSEHFIFIYTHVTVYSFMQSGHRITSPITGMLAISIVD